MNESINQFLLSVRNRSRSGCFEACCPIHGIARVAAGVPVIWGQAFAVAVSGVRQPGIGAVQVFLDNGYTCHDSAEGPFLGDFYRDHAVP